MTTHEHEITEPVDLCIPDGTTLDPAALGWSRVPLHRANLDGRPGENKRWDYWAILAGDLVVSCVFADVDVIGIADVWWVDLRDGTTGGAGMVAGGGNLQLPERPGTAPLHAADGTFTLDIVDDPNGTRLTAGWTEPDGRLGHFDVTVALPPGHESLNVVIPWSDRLYNFTSKHQARPAQGEFVIGDVRWPVGQGGDEAWGVLDVGRGRWPSQITWNWGGGAGTCGEHVVGLQFGAKWTEGSGFTENGIIVDGRLSKLGNEVEWIYNWDDPMQPWRIVDPGGQLDVTLNPRYDKHSKAAGEAVDGSETHQVFGTWSGRLRTDDGLELEVDGLQGFAEEARQDW
ncbi:MAG TPA: DUF2804 domain-containing protein [Ilumatobacteraceae bacterium]|nr:DUF2804 domain-containing protein [Ilumatobacteraceae bacterium]